jgi:hypothetical protein
VAPLFVLLLLLLFLIPRIPVPAHCEAPHAQGASLRLVVATQVATEQRISAHLMLI